MVYAMAILLLAAVVCVLFARSCNGKGPEAGVAGLFAYLLAALFVLAAVLTGCVWLGMHLH